MFSTKKFHELSLPYSAFAQYSHEREFLSVKLYKIGLSFAETNFCYLGFLCGEKIYLSVISPKIILS